MAILAHQWQARLTYYYRLAQRRCYTTSVSCWKDAPFFLYGLGLLCGFGFCLSQKIFTLLPILFIAFAVDKKHLFFFLIVAFTAYFFCPKTSFSLQIPVEAFDRHLEHRLGRSHAANFLIGIFTGNFDNTYLKKLLGDVGLQHVLAISGFHFSLIASLLGIIIRRVLPHKISLVVLMLLLLLYMLYVGTAPSLIRALISIEIIFLGQFLSRSSNSINRLGLSLIVILLMDPQNALRLGFQLSFLATLGILLFYKPFEKLLSYTLVRSYLLKDALQLRRSHQIIYIFANFLKKSLALGLSVNIFLYPVLITYFNQFPLLCLIYNLFFPFLVTFSMALLLIALLLDPFYIGILLHKFNLLYTDILLKTVTGLPVGIKINIYGYISPTFCALIICSIFLLGLSLQKRPSQFNL